MEMTKFWTQHILTPVWWFCSSIMNWKNVYVNDCRMKVRRKALVWYNQQQKKVRRRNAKWWWSRVTRRRALNHWSSSLTVQTTLTTATMMRMRMSNRHTYTHKHIKSTFLNTTIARAHFIILCDGEKNLKIKVKIVQQIVDGVPGWILFDVVSAVG